MESKYQRQREETLTDESKRKRKTPARFRGDAEESKQTAKTS